MISDCILFGYLFVGAVIWYVCVGVLRAGFFDICRYESQGAQWDGSGGLVEQGEWDISVNIPGVGISLVDGTPKVSTYSFLLFPAFYSSIDLYLLSFLLGASALVHSRDLSHVCKIQHIHNGRNGVRLHAN